MKKFLLAALPLLALGSAPGMAQGLGGAAFGLDGSFSLDWNSASQIAGGSAVIGGVTGGAAGTSSFAEVSSRTSGIAASSSSFGLSSFGAPQIGSQTQASFESNSVGLGQSGIGGQGGFVAGTIGGATAGMTGVLNLMGSLQSGIIPPN